MGNEYGVSKSSVSRICADINQVVSAFMTRPLDHTWFPYLYLDATYLDVRQQGRVVSQATVVAVSISALDRREIPGMAVGDSESTDFWTEFLRSLRQRGLNPTSAKHPEGVVWSPTTPTLASRQWSRPSCPAPAGNAAASTSPAASPKPWL